MKKIIGLCVAVAVVIGLVASGTWALFTDVETSAGFGEVCACDVVSFDQGLRYDGQAVDAGRSIATNALNAPDEQFVTLGFGGEIVLDLCTEVCGSLTVWEVTGGDYPEETVTVDVNVSLDGGTWVNVGTADNQTTMDGTNSRPTVIDLGDERVRYVKITDTTASDPPYWDDDADGFDLDAVCGWTCDGNIFCAGTIDIAVEGENPWQGGGFFTIEDMKPCDVEYKTFTITNVGQNEVDIWKHVEVTGRWGGKWSQPECTECGGEFVPGECAGGATDCDESLNRDDCVECGGTWTPASCTDPCADIDNEDACLAAQGAWDPDAETCDCLDEDDDIAKVITYDLTVDARDIILPEQHVKIGPGAFEIPCEPERTNENDCTTGDPPGQWRDTDGDGTGDTCFCPNSSINCCWIYLGSLLPYEEMVVIQSYHLQAETGNWAQGDCMGIMIELFAQQVRGTPPPPTPECPDYEKPNGLD